METGFVFVPAQVFECRAAVQDRRRARRQLAARAACARRGVYLYQEPMEGIDYQIAPPRYLGAVGSAAAGAGEQEGRPPSRRSALAAGVRVDDYRTSRDLFGQYEPPQREPPPPHAAAGGRWPGGALFDGAAEADGSGAEAEPPNQRRRRQRRLAGRPKRAGCRRARRWPWRSSMIRAQRGSRAAALQLCLEWHHPQVRQPPWLQKSSDGSDASAAAANSIIGCSGFEHAEGFGVGEVEALDAGIKDHGKELAVLHQHVLVEKSLPQLIEMYYVTGWRHQSP